MSNSLESLGLDKFWRCGTADNNRLSAPPSAALRFATVLGPCTLTEPCRFAPFVPFARIRRRLEYKNAPDRAVLRTNLRFAQTSDSRTRYAKWAVRTVENKENLQSIAD